MTKTEAITGLRRVLRMRHYALATEDNYVHWTGRFFDWLAKHGRDVESTPAARMEGFLSDLARADVSASTQNQAFSALLFFYRNVLKQEPGKVDALRARRPKFLRHAPPRGDVAKILAADAGANLRDIQEILGHKSLETTMVYVHPEIERVVSPLECLPVHL